MGLNLSLLVFSNDGRIDLSRPLPPSASDDVMRGLFPRTAYRRTERRRLLDFCFPERSRPLVGVFEDGALMATRDAHLHDPPILHRRYTALHPWRDVRLITSRSIYDMAAYGHWIDRDYVRSFSVNGNVGVWRDDGDPEPFEEGFPVAAESWLDLVNAALYDTVRLSGDCAPIRDDYLDWEDVPMYEYSRDPAD